MKLEINSMFSVLMLLLTGSTQTGGQIRTSPSPDLTKDPRDELLQRTHNPAGWDKMSADPPTTTSTRPTVRSETSTEAGPNAYFYPSSSTASQHTNSSSSSSAALSDSEGRPSSSHPTLQDVSFKDPTSTKHPESGPSTASTWNTGLTPTLASGRAPAGPTNQEGPPKLNVEDKALKASHRRSSSPLDPLLAGLLSVFIVTTAIVFVVLFFKFRQRTNHPEFHRLQDLPMDDLMEDTPLSRYTH